MHSYEIEKRIRKQAIAEGMADSVLTLLKTKGAVSLQVETAIRSQTDIDVLEQWLMLAADVKSVEEFQKRLEDDTEKSFSSKL